MARSEEDILLGQAAVKLAGKDYTIKVKSIRETHTFRKRLGVLLAGVFPGGDLTAKAAMSFASLLPTLLSDGVDMLVDLPALYAPELTEAAQSATEDELLEAGIVVLELTFPLVQRLIQTITRLGEMSQAMAGK
ncbi:MAG: hypothetical protein WC551_12005 [Patescibacteria group bacterium]